MVKLSFDIPIFCLLILLIPKTYASQSINLDFSQKIVALGPHLEFFQVADQAGPHGGQIHLDTWQQYFGKSQSLVPNFHFTLDEIWVKLQFNYDNQTTLPTKAFIEHRYVHTDNVELFIPDGTQTYLPLRLGDRHPASNQIIPYYFPVFPITLMPGKNVFYLRVQSKEVTTLPLYLNLNSQNNLKYDKSAPEYIGLFCLLIATMILLLCIAKDKGHNKYLPFYLLCLLFYASNHFFIQGFANKHFPDRDWSYWMNEGYFLTAIGYQISLLLASWHFLEWQQLPHWFRKLRNWALGTSLSIIFATLLLPYQIVVFLYFTNAAFQALVIVVGILYQVARKNRKSFFYMASWSYGVIILIQAVSKFSISRYEHSFGFYFAGILHLLIMSGYFLIAHLGKTERLIDRLFDYQIHPKSSIS